MTTIDVRTGDAPALEAFLMQRIYEHNAAATGYHDGESFNASCANETGSIEAGISGFTWGGVCFVANLWVAEARRRHGLGTDLLAAVEKHAMAKRCRLILVSSHTFQAPEFYACRGYEVIARIDDYPVGHADIFLVKRLEGVRLPPLSAARQCSSPGASAYQSALPPGRRGQERPTCHGKTTSMSFPSGSSTKAA